jgi:hypothetical protein
MDTITVKPEDLAEVGENLQMARIGNMMVIVIPDMTKNLGLSTSGKSQAIASSGGMSKMGGLLFNLWLGRKL